MTSADLVRTMADRLRDTKLVVVANRQPYVHEKQVTVRSGLQTLGAAPGRQGAHQLEAARERSRDRARSGDAGLRRHVGRARQRQSAISRRRIRRAVSRFRPTPKYSLRRVWLKPQEENGYYYGRVEQRALAAVSHRVRAAGLQPGRLAALCRPSTGASPTSCSRRSPARARSCSCRTITTRCCRGS